MFLADPDTNLIIMIGEIGGAAEEDAADFIKSEAKQGPQSRWPASLLDMTAPPGRRMGHGRGLHRRRQGQRRTRWKP